MKKLLILALLLFIPSVVSGAISGSYTISSGAGACTADTACGSWAEFITELSDETLGDDLTCTISAEVFDEAQTEPAEVNVALAGYTLHIKPATNSNMRSTDGGVGPKFILGYNAAAEFLHLDPTGTGTIIIEGITVVVEDNTATSTIVYPEVPAGVDVHIRNNVFINNDVTSPNDGIGMYLHGGNVFIYNNVLVGFQEAILVSTFVAGDIIAHNTIVNSTVDGIDLASLAHTDVYNNLVTGSGTADFINITGATGTNNFCGDATCLDATWGTGTNNSESQTISFTNPSNNEYFLNAGSAGVDGGVVYDNANLVARWRLERDGSGNPVLLDETANDNDLTTSAAADSIFDCEDGYAAAEFTHTNSDFYSIPYTGLSADFPGIAASDFTVTGYFRFNTSVYQVIASHGDANTWGVIVQANNRMIVYIAGWGVGVTHDTALTLGDTYFFGVSYDLANTETAITIWNMDDGVKVTPDETETGSATLVAENDDTFYLGRNFQPTACTGEPCYFDGMIDDIQIRKSEFTYNQMEMVMRLNTDLFGRPRDGSPDVGAIEYIEPREFYISLNNGVETNSGADADNEWFSFTNLSYRIANPGDTIYLAQDDSFDDVLNLKGVGNIGNHITVTSYVDDTTVSDPIIDGGAADGMRIFSSYTDFSSIDVVGCPNDGIYAKSSYNLTFDTIEITDNGDFTEDDSWNTGDLGVWLSYCNEVALTDCTVTGNAKGGVMGDFSRNIDIDGGTYSNNGQVSPYEWPIGIGLNNTSAAAGADYLTVRNATVSNNGRRGLDVGQNGLIENNTVEYNGEGWGANGVVVFGCGSCAGTTFSVGDTATQGSSTGKVLTHKSANHNYNDSTTWLAIVPDTIVTQATADADSTGTTLKDADVFDTLNEYVGYYIRNYTNIPSDFTTITANDGSGTATLSSNIDLTVGEKYDIYYQFDNSTAITGGGTWTPNSETWFGVPDRYSAGGIDMVYAIDSTVRYNNIGYTFATPDAYFDSYGINIDTGCTGALVHNNYIYMNDGSGIATNQSGAVANGVYNNTIYGNCIDEDIDDCAGIYVNDNISTAGIDIKNNIIHAVGHAGSHALDIDDIDMLGEVDNNYYYKDSGEIIIAESTEYGTGDEVAYREALEAECDSASSPMTCCDGSGAGDCEDNSSFTDPALESPPTNMALSSTSPCIEGGDDMAAEIGCVAYDTCYDIGGQKVPQDGENDNTNVSWDCGADEYRYPAINGPYGWTITGGSIKGAAQ